MKPKIIFLGTSEFGAIVLEGLMENNYKPVLVVAGADKPVGRKQILTPPPVKLLAQRYEIPVFQPERIRNLKLEIRNLKPDLGIVAAYGHLIPQEILTIPKYGFLNLHPSLLPKYRGPSPIQAAILNGDKETGVTIILMDEKIDHGPILSQREWEIPNPKHQIPNKSQIPITKITYQELHNRLAKLGAELLVDVIPKWINGEIKPKPQNEKKATYTKIIKKEDGKIDWSKPAIEIERQIRAFYPWPGSFTFFKKNNPPGIQRTSKVIRVKILEADVSKDNKLIIKKLQPEGKKPMSVEEFLQGHRNFSLEIRN